jgi:hypothetical protein
VTEPVNWTREQLLERHDEVQEMYRRGERPSDAVLRELSEANRAYVARYMEGWLDRVIPLGGTFAWVRNLPDEDIQGFVRALLRHPGADAAEKTIREWRETAEILGEPGALAEITAAAVAVERGDVVSGAEVAEDLRKRRQQSSAGERAREIEAWAHAEGVCVDLRAHLAKLEADTSTPGLMTMLRNLLADWARCAADMRQRLGIRNTGD